MRTAACAAVLLTSLVSRFAFSQMHYSRERSHSPTPTPTPTQQHQQIVPAQKQPLIPAQNQAPAQRLMPVPKATQPPIAPKSMSIPAPRATPMPVQPKAMAAPAPTPAKPTPTPVPPPDVNAYLDHQVANSKDKKFHMTVNGKDLALTPFHVWMQKSTGPDTTSTSVSMRSDEGGVYDIEFVTTGAQVTGIRIHRINGETLR